MHLGPFDWQNILFDWASLYKLRLPLCPAYVAILKGIFALRCTCCGAGVDSPEADCAPGHSQLRSVGAAKACD